MATGLAQAWELAPHPRLKSIPFPTYCSEILNMTMYPEKKTERQGKARKGKEKKPPGPLCLELRKKIDARR